jgi:hypothetical protein
MNVGRRTDGLLSASATLRLLSLASARPQTIEELQAGLRLLESASLARTANTLSLLLELKILFFRDGFVAVDIPVSNTSDVSKTVAQRLLGFYLSFLTSVPLGSLFQLREGEEDLWVDRLQLPGRELGLPYALLEFEVFRRDAPEDRFWRVAAESRDAFFELINQINHSTAQQLSLRGLKALQKAQGEAGLKGEEFVVSFEKEMRSRHPLANLIRSISSENVGAGFDVLSFETDTTLIHDKFIEVKSFSGTAVFYWSAGEIAAAQELQERYWLYLVDRERICELGYEPEMIQNPHVHFIERIAEGWLREEQGYKFTMIPIDAFAGSRAG